MPRQAVSVARPVLNQLAPQYQSHCRSAGNGGRVTIQLGGLSQSGIPRAAHARLMAVKSGLGGTTTRGSSCTREGFLSLRLSISMALFYHGSRMAPAPRSMVELASSTVGMPLGSLERCLEASRESSSYPPTCPYARLGLLARLSPCANGWPMAGRVTRSRRTPRAQQAGGQRKGARSPMKLPRLLVHGYKV